MRDRRLLVAGLVLVAASLIGMSVTAPAGGWWGGMHSGPMMGWWGGGANASSAPPVVGAGTISVEATEFRFDPDRVVVSTGEAVNLTLVNRGALLHDLTVPDLGLRLVAGPGETVTAGLAAQQPGEYRLLCTVPGHAEAGMVGWLVVEDSSS